MKKIGMLFIVGVLLVVMGCGGSARRANKAQRKAYDAQRQVYQERLKLVDQYRKCLEKSAGDMEKVEACDSYLRAAEALK